MSKYIRIEDLDGSFFDADEIIRKPLPTKPSDGLLDAVLHYALDYMKWLGRQYHIPYPGEDIDHPTRETLAESVEYVQREIEAAAKRVFEIASINLLNTHNQVLKVMKDDPPPAWSVPKETKEPTTH